jgi:hypothetical protein
VSYYASNPLGLSRWVCQGLGLGGGGLGWGWFRRRIEPAQANVRN